MLLTDILARIRQHLNGPSSKWSCVHTDDLAALIAVAEAAQTLATAADALLDVTVAATPNTRLSSVAKQIGALNRAWKEYQDAT